MLNKYLLVAFLIFANLFGLSAQVDSKYLVGAVPQISGKIVINREIKLPAEVDQKEMFRLMQEWANQEYGNDGQEILIKRILVSSPEENYIACQGDDYLVFKSAALVLDRAKMYYQLIIRSEKDKYSLEFRNIKYDYPDFERTTPAEELITDKLALNKEGTKLNRYYTKFRTFSIDRIDEVTENFRNFLVNKFVKVEATPASTVQIVGSTPSATSSLPVSVAPVAKQEQITEFNYKLMGIEDLSDDVLAMFKENWALLAMGTKELPAAWSGVGSFGGKPVAMSLVKTNDNTVDDIYTISFYTPIHKGELDKIAKEQKSNLTPISTPSGAKVFSEAWMIIECKKVLEQPVTDTMSESIQSRAWGEDRFNKLVMGEIINIWAR